MASQSGAAAGGKVMARMIAVMTASSISDLHLHSDVSDGVLSPQALMALVARQGVGLAALTDHDSLEGCTIAQQAAAELGLRCLAGVEVTCGWRGQELHVIGLAPRVPPAGEESALTQHLARIRSVRRTRLQAIADRLETKSKLPTQALVAPLLADRRVPTRLHLARALVEAGHARDVADAFDRWLSRGRPGHVPASWPTLEETLAVLQSADATIVLAHPHRYRVSAGVLNQLVGEFAGGGGHALEVSVGGMSRNDLDRIATLTRRHRLAASCGSDFHDPGVPWNPPGRFVKLPDDLEPVADRLR